MKVNTMNSQSLEKRVAVRSVNVSRVTPVVFGLLLAVMLLAGLSAPLRAWAPSTFADEPARVSFAHFAPFAPEAASAVDIQVGSTVVVSGLLFGESSAYLPFESGEYTVTVTPVGAAQASLVYTLALTQPVDLTVAFIGNGVNRPLDMLVLVDDNSTPPLAGQARLRIAHLAPLPALVAPSVLDMCTERNAPPFAAGLSYRGHVVVTVPAGIYDTFIATGGTNCALPLVPIPPFRLLDGQIAYAYAVGDAIRVAPTVVTRPDLSVPEYRLHLPSVAVP
jgi:hypothetical protein